MRRLTRLLHSIREAPNAEALKSCVMDQAGEALGCDKSGLYFFEPGSAHPSEIYIRHLPERFILKYEEIGRDDDRVLTRVMRTQRVAYDMQTFTAEEWMRSLLYRSFSLPYRIRHYLCVPIVRDASVVGTLNLGRSSDEANFDEPTAIHSEAVTRAIRQVKRNHPVQGHDCNNVHGNMIADLCIPAIRPHG